MSTLCMLWLKNSMPDLQNGSIRKKNKTKINFPENPNKQIMTFFVLLGEGHTKKIFLL